MSNTMILNMDVIEGLRSLPDDHFDCVVTSPPYWGLRDYGVPGQLGLEPTIGEHLEAMVAVFEEVKRVLKPTGTLWLNYGDCYATSPNGRSAADTKAAGGDDRTFRDKPFSTIGGVLKAKDLCMIPNRLAIALQEAGWWVRSEIIWAKPNGMPESIKDRPGTSHEKIFMLTKKAKYFYNYEGSRSRRHDGFNDRWDHMTKEEQQAHGRGLRNYEPAPMQVWEIATSAFRDAHFATFPPELVERCLKAGCPEGGRVLDPFGGSGTTAMVACQMGMHPTIIELNPDYVQIAWKRIVNEAPMFNTVTVEPKIAQKNLL